MPILEWPLGTRRYTSTVGGPPAASGTGTRYVFGGRPVGPSSTGSTRPSMGPPSKGVSSLFTAPVSAIRREGRDQRGGLRVAVRGHGEHGDELLDQPVAQLLDRGLLALVEPDQRGRLHRRDPHPYGHTQQQAGSGDAEMPEDVLGGGPSYAVDDGGGPGRLHHAAALQERAETGVVLVDEGEVAVEGAGQTDEQGPLPGLVEALLQLIGGGAEGGLVELLLAAGEVPVDEGAGDSGRFRHVVEGDVLGNPVREEGEGGFEKLAPTLLDTQPTVSGSGWGHASKGSRPPADTSWLV